MKLDNQVAIDDLIRELSVEISQVYRWVAEQAGLNQTDLMSLYFISRAEGAVTPKMLTEHLGLTTGATAILLNRLEARGYVVRSPHPTDRRGVLLTMGTATAGREFLNLRERLLGLNAEVIEALTPEDAAVVRRFIASIVTNARNALRQFRHKGTTAINPADSA